MAKLTIKSLQAELETLKRNYDTSREQLRSAESSLRASKDEEVQARLQFGDLKQRLANSELENQRMRGYIARVQEDDTVREDLIAVGDPEGEHQMVPKRKPTSFEMPSQYSNAGCIDTEYRGYSSENQRRKAKHWVTY